MKIVDSHFHIKYLSSDKADLSEILKTLYCGIDVGTVYDDLQPRFELLSDFPRILKSAAMGPWETDNSDITEIDRKFTVLKANIEKFKPDFLGEFGLDNHDVKGSIENQEYLMRKQMEYASESKLKVLIHNREADRQMIAIIPDYPEVSGVIHCFSGSIDVMRTALDLGYYISYAGNVTFKSNNSLRETLKYVPRDRLLLETDSPYLTPVPKRGQPNTPGNIIYTYKCVADYLETPVEEFAACVFDNFNDFCQHRF